MAECTLLLQFCRFVPNMLEGYESLCPQKKSVGITQRLALSLLFRYIHQHFPSVPELHQDISEGFHLDALDRCSPEAFVKALQQGIPAANRLNEPLDFLPPSHPGLPFRRLPRQGGF